MTGALPLAGIRVVELEGIGPGPTCAMLLSDFGAEVLQISRPGYEAHADPVTGRGKAILALDLKTAEGGDRLRTAISAADVLIDPFRPGVMEKLGFGPEPLLADHRRLIFARLTGWGQTGPLAARAGHDINYIGLTGALEGIGRPGEAPPPPLNLIGDMGGGAALAAFGICAALIERERSGLGQVIDASILDGTAALMGMFRGMKIPVSRQDSLLGGAMPFYDSYRCADGRHIAVGALEPQFWGRLADVIGLPEPLRDRDSVSAEVLREALSRIFLTRSRDEWTILLESIDACATPVLSIGEAVLHPHAREREMYSERDGVIHPAPAPRLSRTPARIGAKQDAEAMLERWHLPKAGRDPA